MAETKKKKTKTRSLRKTHAKVAKSVMNEFVPTFKQLFTNPHTYVVIFAAVVLSFIYGRDGATQSNAGLFRLQGSTTKSTSTYETTVLDTTRTTMSLTGGTGGGGSSGSGTVGSGSGGSGLNFTGTARMALTWKVRNMNAGPTGLILVGTEGGDPYKGDTNTTTSLPILCVKPLDTFNSTTRWKNDYIANFGQEAFDAAYNNFYNGWKNAEIALTPAIQGTRIGNRFTADYFCRTYLGNGRSFAEFHHNASTAGTKFAGTNMSGGWNWFGVIRGATYGGTYGSFNFSTYRQNLVKFSTATRFWIGINDEETNPWGRGW